MSHRLPPPADVEKALGGNGGSAPLTVRELAVKLGLPPGSRPALRRLVQQMVDENRVVAVRGRRFVARRTIGDTVGRFTRHRAGFGFVTPDDPTRDDLFIPAGAQGGAMHGDVVAARVVNVKPDGRRDGEIVNVVERHSTRIVGLIEETYSGGGMLQPLDAGYDFRVLVPKKRMDGAQSGELVRVELEAFPDGTRPGRGRVIERLGRPNEPGVDIEVLIRKYELSPEFPDQVQDEVRELPGRPEDWPLAEREDFSEQLAVTIDGETAKDFDDAISVERLDGGRFRLHVHIADVGFFVPEGSETDREALRRGTSVYFPGRVVPMLPERLSNDLCSLRPDRIRLTQGISIDYDAEGQAVSSRCHDGFIRSKARLTYTEVAAMMEGGDAKLRRKHRALLPMLEAAVELTGLTSARREARGAIDFDLPEPEIIIALTGETTEIVARRRNLAHRMIEEFMIAANEAVAVQLVEARRPALYRVHERPDPARLARLADLVSGLGYKVPAPFESITPRALAKLVGAAAGRPEEPYLQRVVLRTMALARYDPDCLGHFGLALRRYLHFTSPIRRYPDLVVHRELRGKSTGKKRGAGEQEEAAARLPELARECSRLEREAESAERESISWKVAAFMADRLGDEFSGRIVDVAPHGLTVLIDEPFVEGLIPMRRLGEEYFRYDAQKRIVVGSETGKAFRLGQEVEVRVDRVDLLRHFIDLCLVDAPAQEERGKGKPPRSGKRGKSLRSGKPGKSSGNGKQGKSLRSGKPGKSSGNGKQGKSPRSGGRKKRGGR